MSTNDVRFIVRVAASYLSLQSSEIHNSTQATHRAQFQRSTTTNVAYRVRVFFKFRHHARFHLQSIQPAEPLLWMEYLQLNRDGIYKRWSLK